MARLPLQASSELQEALHKLATKKLLPAGTVLFSQGERAQGVYLVQSGSVVLMLADESDGKTICERTLGAGSLLGLPATMNDGPYSLGAKAVSDVEVEFVWRDALLAEMARNVSLTIEVLKVLSFEVHDMRDMIRKWQPPKTAVGRPPAAKRAGAAR